MSNTLSVYENFVSDIFSTMPLLIFVSKELTFFTSFQVTLVVISVYSIIFSQKVKLGQTRNVFLPVYLVLLSKNMFSLVSVVTIVFMCLGLGGIVYFKNRKGKINQMFAALVFFVVIWLVSNFLENANISHETASMALKIDFASASILAYFFFLFAINFQGNHLIRLRSKLQQVLAFVPTFVFSILSFSSLIIYNVSFENHIISFETGMLFPLYAFGLFAYIGTGCVDLVLKYRKLKGIEKVQTLYVMLGFSISAVIALVINLFFQDIVSVDVFRVGNYGIFFFVGFTTYAVLKHHLLDVKVIFTEILVVAIALLLFVQIFISQTLFEYLWKSILFFIFLLSGYLLIRSVLLEIKRRTELQHLYREVDKLSKTKSEFISIASHQLRTPLAAIKGYISMILEGTYGKIDQEARKPMENVYQSNERLIKLVNDLLDLSRLEAGKIEFQPESISLEELISGVVEELKINVQKKGLYIKTMKSSESLPKIIADKEKLRQVILNIVDNAIKYTKTGGITIGLKRVDSRPQIKISDTGMGMTEEEIKNLFQMFSRSKTSSRLHTEGTGIGLYIAKKFVEMHKGKLWAESQGRGKGSAFFIELPIK
ncbi:MAG: ATP-binding protein [Pseudomonadota bacterium]